MIPLICLMDKTTEAITIRNFIQYYGKPFTINDIENDTKYTKQTILKELQQHEKIGTVKSISNERKQKIYIKSQKYHLMRLDATVSINTIKMLDDILNKGWNFKPSRKTLQLISDYMQEIKVDKVYNIAKKLNISIETVNRYINVLECIGSVNRDYRSIIWIKYVNITQIKLYHYYIEQLNREKTYLNQLDDITKVLKKILRQKEQQRIQFLLENVFV